MQSAEIMQEEILNWEQTSELRDNANERSCTRNVVTRGRNDFRIKSEFYGRATAATMKAFIIKLSV